MSQDQTDERQQFQELRKQLEDAIKTDERQQFQQLREQLEDAIKQEYQNSKVAVEDSMRKQRSLAISEMSAALKRGDLLSAKTYEMMVMQYNLLLRETY